mmetsp:Transcript_27134/g.69934  ORF Transcript_27134/g.69934 Transcript_27134/m.69934 type:complete len:150 (+) Transcript_27134:144-593(+)
MRAPRLADCSFKALKQRRENAASLKSKKKIASYSSTFRISADPSNASGGKIRQSTTESRSAPSSPTHRPRAVKDDNGEQREEKGVLCTQCRKCNAGLVLVLMNEWVGGALSMYYKRNEGRRISDGKVNIKCTPGCSISFVLARLCLLLF